jgi:hypothetical protein
MLGNAARHLLPDFLSSRLDLAVLARGAPSSICVSAVKITSLTPVVTLPKAQGHCVLNLEFVLFEFV